MTLVLRPALLLAGLVLAGLAVHLLPQDGAAGALAALDASHGVTGAALFVVVAACLCAIGVPRQVAAYAAGYAFGVWPGAAIALAAQMAACAMDFFWARFVARDWAQRWMRRRRVGHLPRINAVLIAHPFTATITLRLLPVGNNLVLNLLAGIAGVPAGAFLAASAVGYLPQTVIFALVGAGTHVERGVQLAVGVLLFAASAAAGAMLLRRVRVASPAQ